MVIAVFSVLVLGLVPPARFMIGPIPLFPLVVGILLGVLVVGDPGRIDRRARWLRNVSIALVGVLVFGALAGTAVLIIDLVQGSSLVNEAGPLLIYGAKVWLANNVAFALLFWQMDRGGPAERVHGTHPLSRLRVPPGSGPVPRGTRLAAPVHRLPVCRIHERQRLQPHGHDAAHRSGQAGHGDPGAHLVRDPDPRPGAGRERLHVGTGIAHRPTLGADRARARRRLSHWSDFDRITSQGEG